MASVTHFFINRIKEEGSIMKKLCILLCLILCISTLTGCFSLLPTSPNSSNDETESNVSSEPVVVSDTEILSKDTPAIGTPFLSITALRIVFLSTISAIP